ncbi:hypothetical protein [Natrinema sp. H-ect4]|uniref:hypothetical protein n=1 Tax=Natrinema sp. H-ect4 TaxID=3242699 RepID=UPI0035A84A02
MSKDRKTFSLDPDVADYLDDPSINASGLVNRLLREYFEGGGSQGMMVELRKQQLRHEKQSLEQQQEVIDEELERLDEQEEKASTEYETALTPLLDTLEKGGHVWPDHQLVKEVARDYAVEPDRVIGDLRERAGGEISDDQFKQP